MALDASYHNYNFLFTSFSMWSVLICFFPNESYYHLMLLFLGYYYNKNNK